MECVVSQALRVYAAMRAAGMAPNLHTFNVLLAAHQVSWVRRTVGVCHTAPQGPD